MRKTVALSLLAGVSLGAAAVWAQTSVYSANVVGFVTVDIPRGGMVMLRNDFVNQSGSSNVTPSTLFGTNLPVNTAVYKWTTSGVPGYQISTYKRIVGPPPTFKATTNWTPDTITLERGGGFWLQIPTNAPNASYSISISGEVPTDSQATVPVAEGLNMLAYMFPTEILWTNTTLAAKAKAGDAVYLWGGASYSVNTLQAKTGPPPTFLKTTNWSIPTMKIPVGRSVWYMSARTNTWTEARPYSF